MIEVIDDRGLPVMINLSDVSAVSKQHYRGCAITLKNGETILTETTSYETIVKAWKKAMVKQ